MPVPGKDEDKKSFITRCIPIVINEGTTKDPKQAAAICHSIWRKNKKDSDEDSEELSDEFIEFTFTNVHLCSCYDSEEKNTNQTYEEVDIDIAGKSHKFIKTTAVAVVGNRFMKGVFVSHDELKKTLDFWNSTLHDINHMGTSSPDSFYGLRPNIEYFVGFQKNARIDEKTKALSVDVYINTESPKYAAWKSYIDTCIASNRVPNVSMSVWAKTKPVRAKDLPSDVNYKEMGINDNTQIAYMHDIIPRALTTGFEGVCSDKDGCGIGIKSESLYVNPCNCVESTQLTDSKTDAEDVSPTGENECECESQKAYRNKLVKLKKYLEGGK